MNQVESRAKDLIIERLDGFYSEALDGPLAEIEPWEIRVVGSERRLRREEGYGAIFPFWLLLARERCLISVRPDLEEPVQKIVRDAPDARELFEEEYAVLIEEALRKVLARDLLERLRRSHSLGFYATQEHFRPFTVSGCRRLTSEDRALVEEMDDVGVYGCPEESVQDGTAFGVVVDGQLVARSSVVPTPEMTAKYRLAWPGVETLPEHRRRGYARAVVAGTTETLLARGITPAYDCAVANVGSANTARSVGYRLYSERLTWRYHWRAEG